MISFRQSVGFMLAVLSFVSVFYSVGRLVLFLSTPVQLTFETKLLTSLLENKDLLKATAFAICCDSILAILFIFQHSCMKSDVVKNFWVKLKMQNAERSIYNIASALSLIFLLHNWKSAPAHYLWNLDISGKTTTWWTLVIFHGLLWSVIYGGSLLMDLAELLGIKQVYYEINDLAPPLSYKSVPLKRLFSHVRHPSFIAKTLILWTTNFMSLDRLLLALLWTIYMYVAWNTDARDVAYQKKQLSRKKFELDHDLSR